MIRIAVAGAGLVGARHAGLIASQPDLSLAGIVDPASGADRVAANLGTSRFADLDRLLAATPVDAIIVATPNQTHEQVAVAAAQRGLHLLVEKPIAHDTASADRLIAAADAAGVQLLVGHHRRYHPFVARARDLLSDGTLGQLVAVSAQWMLRKDDDYFSDQWRRQAGGGMILINLIHDIDILRHLAGEIVETSALAANAARGESAVDAAVIALRFQNGALATVLASDATPSPWGWEAATGENPNIPFSGQGCYRFFGTKAALDFPSLTIWRHHGPGPGDWSVPLFASEREGPNTPAESPLLKQLRHFSRVIQGIEPPRVTGKDAAQSLAITLDLIKQGGLSGRAPHRA